MIDNCNNTKIIIVASNRADLYSVTRSKFKGQDRLIFKNNLPQEIVEMISVADITANLGCGDSCGVNIEIKKGSYNSNTKSVDVIVDSSPYANNANNKTQPIDNYTDQLYVNFNVVNPYKLQQVADMVLNTNRHSSYATASTAGSVQLAYDNLSMSSQTPRKVITTDSEAMALFFEAFFGDTTTIVNQLVTGSTAELRKKKIISNFSKFVNQVLSDDNKMDALGNNLGVDF